MSRFHHIAVPVDFEEPSRGALDVAIDLAHSFDASLTIVHVWEIPSYAYAGMAYVSVDMWTPLEQAAKQQLESTLALARKRLPRAEALLAKGATAAEILAAVARVKADLIVMGTHGRHGVSRFLLGSVAERTVRSSPVPVLTVRGGEPGA